MLKRIIKENLNTFETERVLERLLKNNILVTTKKGGDGIIIKLVGGDKLTSFDTDNETDLENLYDQLYPIISNILERSYSHENAFFNTKRKYELVVKLVERIKDMFSGKQRVDQKKIEKVLDKTLESFYLNFDDPYLKIDGRDLQGLNKHNVDELVKKLMDGKPISAYYIKDFSDNYKKTIKDIFEKLHNDFGVSYREAKPSIIKAFDNVVERRTGFKHFTNSLRRIGFNVD